MLTPYKNLIGKSYMVSKFSKKVNLSDFLNSIMMDHPCTIWQQKITDIHKKTP